jgi:hypothetical protein
MPENLVDKAPLIKQEMQWVTQDDVPKTWIYQDLEYSHRLITNKRQGSSLSFHITYCLQGDSRQIIEETGREVHFTPGMALYLPKVYRYRHIIGPKGLVVAVACTPPRE